jgi:hypothetical protein
MEILGLFYWYKTGSVEFPFVSMHLYSDVVDTKIKDLGKRRMSREKGRGQERKILKIHHN